MYAKDPCEAKYQINKRESIGLKHFNDRKAFIKYSIYMQDVYKNRKMFIVFDNMIADMINKKKTKCNSNRIVY